jgi:hypothetical protein
LKRFSGRIKEISPSRDIFKTCFVFKIVYNPFHGFTGDGKTGQGVGFAHGGRAYPSCT